jgi:hypothetical protein
MKYIVTALNDKELIFIFPRDVDHDRMAEAIAAIRFGSDQNWERKLRKDGELISAGFIDNGECHGRSETLGIESRGMPDTELLINPL